MPPHHPQLQTLTFQSPVGRWRLHLWTPSPDLAPAVAQLWAVESDTREFQEKVLPRGTVEFMINLGDPHHLLSEDGVAHRRKHAWISGLQTACLHVHSPHPARLIAASLYPAHAPLLLDAPAQELSTRVHEWENPSLRALRERLLHTPTSIARFALLETRLGPSPGRKAIGDFLFKEMKVDAWWVTTLAVEFEAARHIRAKDGRPAGYNICVTKSIAAPPERIFALLESTAWAGSGTQVVFAKLAPPKSARFTLQGPQHPAGETVEIKLSPAGAKSSLVLNHERIQDRGRADGLREAWSEILQAWKTQLES